MTEMRIENRFKGRTAVVTGGASGIGHGIARRLADEGANVVVWDIANKALEADLTLENVDVVDESAVAQAIARIDGGPDILVASAGITGPNLPTWDYPLEAWKQVFELNTHGVFVCNRAAARTMREKGSGRIVNIASIAGKEGNPNASAYSASKAAVIGLTKSLGKELATSGVTVNCVAPAAVETAIFEQMTAEHIDYMKSKIPMGRFGTIDEISAMVCWLASDEASFSTGAVFDPSGGRAVY